MPTKNLLKQRDAKFRLLFEDNPLPMWVFDRETLRFLEANQAAVAHYGYTREEFLAMSLVDIRPPEDVPRLMDSIARADGLSVSEPWRHRLKDGRLIDVEVASHTISYGGRPAVLSVLKDVTERKLLEEQLRRAAKMEAVGMLAGGIAHDFNNLLTIINGYSHILLKALPSSDPNRSAVEQIMKAGERAAALTRQLLSHSRRQVSQPKLVDVNQVIVGLEAMLRRLIGEDIEFRFVPSRNIGQVNADPGQIEQVVMNLVVNSRDAMPRGGVLTIETAEVRLTARDLFRQASVKPGHYVMLVVSDNGSGMDSETQQHLFEPFFTTKPQDQGTGLGMTTVSTIVKKSGGYMDVYSEPGRGTSVKIYLPRVNQPASVESEAPADKPASGSETILLVEDEDQVRNLLRDTLRRDGYVVLDAATAVDARRIADAHPGPIHLLVSDVVMPKEGGRELAASLMSRRPAMKVLLMSGYTNQAALNNNLVTSCIGFLQKPFTPATLLNKIREVLESNGENSQTARG